MVENRSSKPPASVIASVSIKSVDAKSKAAAAGLKVGDQVVAVGGTPVKNVVDALVAMAGAKPGDTLDLEVQRSGDAKTTKLKVPVTKAPVPPVEDLLLSKMGIKAQTITAALKTQYKLAIGQGVYVESVLSDSPAAKCGIAAGDVLIQLGCTA